MNTMDTREAGGGSYPEPPQAWYGSEPEACEECGYTADDLKRVGERLLCPACRRKYWFEHAETGDFANKPLPFRKKLPKATISERSPQGWQKPTPQASPPAWSWQRRKAVAEVKSERRGECEITRQRIHYWFYTENQRHELKGV